MSGTEEECVWSQQLISQETFSEEAKLNSLGPVKRMREENLILRGPWQKNSQAGKKEKSIHTYHIHKLYITCYTLHTHLVDEAKLQQLYFSLQFIYPSKTFQAV